MARNFRTISSLGAKIVAASAGGDHNLFVTADGILYGYGANWAGQLGVDTGGSPVPEGDPVRIASDVQAASAGEQHSVFLKKDGTLWTVGMNYVGQLGDGTTTERDSPVQVATNVVYICAGGNHTTFIKSDGTLWGTGYNNDGQLGDGTQISRSSPIQIDTSVASISAGDYETLYINTDGTLWATGLNDHGQLNDNPIVNPRLTPIQVATGVTSVVGRTHHTLFLFNDHTLWVKGNATPEMGYSLTQVASGVVSAAGGDRTSFYIKTDGTLWAFGDDQSNQLGDGASVDRQVTNPVQVSTNVASVSNLSDPAIFLKKILRSGVSIPLV